MSKIWYRVLCWFGLRRDEITHEELLRRIAEDVTDDDIDRLLPSSLRKRHPKVRS